MQGWEGCAKGSRGCVRVVIGVVRVGGVCKEEKGCARIVIRLVSMGGVCKDGDWGYKGGRGCARRGRGVQGYG